MDLDIKPLNIAPAYERVAIELERQILDGVLQPGHILPTETVLAEKFGVNRSTVREGIRRLESEGLLKRGGGKRLTVSVPRYGDLAPRATRALVLNQVTFLELWNVALALEPLSAALAAANADEDETAAMRANLEALEDALSKRQSPATLDIEFHTLIDTASRNRALTLAREPVGLLLYTAMEGLVPHLPRAGQRTLEAHFRIFDAIERRDADAAADWMRKHVIDFRRGYELANIPLDTPAGFKGETVR